jgi:hypothetical protein
VNVGFVVVVSVRRGVRIEVPSVMNGISDRGGTRRFESRSV